MPISLSAISDFMLLDYGRTMAVKKGVCTAPFGLAGQDASFYLTAHWYWARAKAWLHWQQIIKYHDCVRFVSYIATILVNQKPIYKLTVL